MKSLHKKRSSFFLMIGLCAFISGCSSKPSTGDGKQAIQDRISQDAQGRIKLNSFRKTNGQLAEVNAVKVYGLEFEAEIEFTGDCKWITGLGGIGMGFRTAQLPDKSLGALAQFAADDPMPGTIVKQGQRVKVSGVIHFEKKENGWSVDGIDLNSAAAVAGSGNSSSQAGDGSAGQNLSGNQPAKAGSFIATGAMNITRQSYASVLLPNGNVLAAGGNSDKDIHGTTSAELYDPASGTWTVTGAMNHARQASTMTLLPNRKVLIVGNEFDSGTELYDPVAGTWTTTGDLFTPRFLHTATLLSDGKVLVAGGIGGKSYPAPELSSVELYDSVTGTWMVTGSLNTTRNRHTATLLANGKVLVAGGYDRNVILSSAELYDPTTAKWTVTGSMNTAREGHTATPLANGKVLVSGGNSNPPNNVSSTELYDPNTGRWTMTSAMNNAREGHTATLLPDGKVLVVGGSGSTYFSLSSAELYDPDTGKWTMTNPMNGARAYHTATLLTSGRVLIAGGFNYLGLNKSSVSYSSAELYDSTRVK